MSSVDRSELRDTVADVLRDMRKKGVRLWSDNGRLRYQAPQGALSPQELDRLRVARNQIVAILEASGAEAGTPELELAPRQQRHRAPLALSQIAHRNLYRLNERPAVRQIASATRIRGRLNLGALEKSLQQVIDRHDALRTRIVVCDGVPIQEIDPSICFHLKLEDMTALTESVREQTVMRCIEDLVLEPIDLAVGPLFGARALKLRDEEHVLIMAMEHIISDGYSMKVLLREVFSAYAQFAKGLALSLPPIPLQFADYAVWQEKALPSWLDKHGRYTQEHFSGCGRCRFPVDESLQEENRRGWGIVPLRIGAELKAQLAEWSRLRRTTLAMSVFTAYCATVLRWCDASDAVFQFQGDGRLDPKMENTIGFFAAVLYLRLELLENDNFVTLMQRVTAEYCRAYDHVDSSFLEAQVPRPELTRNTVFNWIPRASKLRVPELEGTEHELACSLIHFSNPVLKRMERDNEPCVCLYDTEGEIIGSVYFPSRFPVGSMERFAENFMLFIRALLRQPEERISRIPLL